MHVFAQVNAKRSTKDPSYFETQLLDGAEASEEEVESGGKKLVKATFKACYAYILNTGICC